MDSLIHLLNNRGQTFCLTFRAFLNTQKYGLFCSLDLGRLEQKTNMMENGLLYLGIKWSLLRPGTDLSSLGIKWSLLRPRTDLSSLGIKWSLLRPRTDLSSLGMQF